MMRLQEEKVGNALLLKAVEKRMDASVSEGFKAKLTELINNGNRLIVLDLSSVAFVDSSGLGAIVSTLKKVGPNGDLAICGLQDSVLSLFKLTRMDRVFRIFPNSKEALAALSA
jgi:anti-sigma B factor antagonist